MIAMWWNIVYDYDGKNLKNSYASQWYYGA